MIVNCGWCQKFLYKKEPLENLDVTHGLCEKCRIGLNQDIDKMGEVADKLNRPVFTGYHPKMRKKWRHKIPTVRAIEGKKPNVKILFGKGKIK